MSVYRTCTTKEQYFYVIATMGRSVGESLRIATAKFVTIFNQNKYFRNVVRYLAIAAGSLFVFALALFLMVWAGVFGSIPGKDELREIQHPIASEVFSSDSVLLGRYYLQDRSPVAPSQIPDNLKHALIATEDFRFYKHSGIDYKSLARVLVKSILLQDESSGGGSTITQQLVKNLYPRKSYSLFSLPVNKIKEFILAKRVENIYSKEEILVLYLNTIPFGDNTYGIKTAADRFFSVEVKDLQPEQSAVLIGMLKATHSYNPRLFPARSLKRRNVVLGQMAKYDFITESEKANLQSLPLKLDYNNINHNVGLAPYFRAYIQEQLADWCKEHKKDDGTSYNLYTDGLKIYTTIDSRLQRYAENAMQTQMKDLQERFQKQLSKKTIDAIAKSRITKMSQYKSLKSRGLSEQEILAELKKPLKTKVFSWEGDKESEISFYDSLIHHLQFLQAGIMAMEPQTGEVRVWVGGIDHRYFQFDHVRESTKRQVGSTIKPLLYSAALEEGISPCAYIDARKTVYTNMEGWAPENTNEKTYDRKYSMEGGLSGSVNTVSVKLLEKTGISKAIQVVRNMGIKSDLPAVPSLALGTPSISVMEMVGAYSVLASGGIYHEPTYLTAITNSDGVVLEKFDTHQGRRAVSDATTQMMVHMLKRVVSEGTAASLRYRYGITNDVVGKTGTTQSNVDGWFIAVMPRLVIGAWVGADDPRMHFRSTALGQGSATALPIVAKFLQQSNKDKSLNNVMWARFPSLPANLERKMDCDQSKSNQNFFEKLFKKKKGVKVTKFKNKRDKPS
jgi:penicillin-binding protein 1A